MNETTWKLENEAQENAFARHSDVNSCSSNYQLNPQYKAKTKTMFLSNKGLHTVEYEGIMRTKIWNQLARLQFMLEFYLRNYKLNTNING